LRPLRLCVAKTASGESPVMNDLDRFHLVADVIDRVPQLGPNAAYAKQAIRDKLIKHKQYITDRNLLFGVPACT
jgi:phosphoketolase